MNAFLITSTVRKKAPPLDTVFLACGPIMSSLADIHTSYDTAARLIRQRFFCAKDQHFLTAEDIHDVHGTDLDSESSMHFGDRLSDCIKSGSSVKVHTVLDEIKDYISGTDDDIVSIKNYLSGIFLHVKQTIMKTYPEKDIPFVHNTAILDLINNKQYLYEIMQYFSEQFDMIMRSISNDSSENILDNVTDYIDHNYQMPIRLEQLASLFGYSSSYLG